MRIITSFVSAVLFRGALGALYTAPQTLPHAEYDFIVVGGNFFHTRSHPSQPHC